MGQKVNPIGFRVGYNRTWDSQWYANKKEFSEFLLEDARIRRYIKDKYASTGIPRITIFRRTPEKVRVTIHTARPGLVVGRRGSEIDRIRGELGDLTNREVVIDVKEVKVPELSAQLVAENIARQLERRVSFRRAMKRTIQDSLARGAQGIKIQAKGRLGGAEMCRVQSYKTGKIPLQTLRADIDYGFAESRTTYGAIGVKVWLYKGEKISVSEEGGNGPDAKKS